MKLFEIIKQKPASIKMKKTNLTWVKKGIGRDRKQTTSSGEHDLFLLWLGNTSLVVEPAHWYLLMISLLTKAKG